MTGWIAAATLAVVVFAVLWRFARLPTGGLYLAAMAVVLALFGYQLQGRPGLQSAASRPPDARASEDRAAVELRQLMYGRFNGEAQWIDFSDTMLRLGATRAAVDTVSRALQKSPRSVPLWVALGNALVAHGQGQLSPAARYAFDRAARLDPDSPAPPFFLGLALANAGDGDAAIGIWFELLKRTPADARWRPEIERRLGMLVLARLAQTKRAPAAAPAPPPPVAVDGSGRPDGGAPLSKPQPD